eukprot:s1606_g13.t1
MGVEFRVAQLLSCLAAAISLSISKASLGRTSSLRHLHCPCRIEAQAMKLISHFPEPLRNGNPLKLSSGPLVGAQEDSPKLLALMAMVREGRLSKEAEALFEAHAKKQKDGQALAARMLDQGFRPRVQDLPKLAAALPSLGVRATPKSAMTRREFQEFLFHYAVSQQSGAKTQSAKTVGGRYRSLDDFHVMTIRRVLLAKAKKTEDRLALKVVHKAPYGEALSGEEP